MNYNCWPVNTQYDVQPQPQYQDRPPGVRMMMGRGDVQPQPQYQDRPPGVRMMMGRGRGRGYAQPHPYGQQQYGGNDMQGNQPHQSQNQVNVLNQMGPPSYYSGEELRVTVAEGSDNGHSSRTVDGGRNRSKSREDESRHNYSETQTGHKVKRERSRSRDKYPKTRWDNPEQNAYQNNGSREGGHRDSRENQDLGGQDQRRYQTQHNPYSEGKGGYNRQGSGGYNSKGSGGYNSQGWGGYNRQGSRSDDDDNFLSRTLSSILRHNAKKFGLDLDKGGFLYVDDILHKVHKLKGFHLSDFQRVVANNDKKRFSMEQDGEGYWKIRANQGHTIEVEELALTPITSADDYPSVIHGTYYESWELIKKTGLKRMNRNHIHFAADMPGASGVISGMRKSCEVVIYLDLEKALKAGLQFFVSANNVILSPGNENGTIYPCFFRGAADRSRGYRLDFDDKIDGSKMAEEKTDSKKKRKKNKSKNKQSEFEEDDETTADKTQQQVNKKPKNSKDKSEPNTRDDKDSVRRKKSLERNQKRDSQSGPEEAAESQSKEELEPDTKDRDTAYMSAEDSAFENSIEDSAHDKMSDCSLLPEHDDSVLAQAHVSMGSDIGTKTEEGSVQDAWDDDTADLDETAPKIPVPEWNEPTVIENSEQSVSLVDSLLKSKAIAVCCAGENLGTKNSKIRLIIVLGKPHIGVYKLDGDGARFMTEGKLHQLLTDTAVPKVLHTIQETAFSLLQEYDVLLDGVPIWDVKMMYEKEGENPAVKEEMLGLKAWNKIEKWSDEIKISDIDVQNLVTRGTFMLHLFGQLHEFFEKDNTKKKKYKSEIYQKAVPNDSPLAAKISQLKLEKKKQAKDSKPPPPPPQQQAKKHKKKKK